MKLHSEHEGLSRPLEGLDDPVGTLRYDTKPRTQVAGCLMVATVDVHVPEQGEPVQQRPVDDVDVVRGSANVGACVVHRGHVLRVQILPQGAPEGHAEYLCTSTSTEHRLAIRNRPFGQLEVGTVEFGFVGLMEDIWERLLIVVVGVEVDATGKEDRVAEVVEVFQRLGINERVNEEWDTSGVPDGAAETPKLVHRLATRQAQRAECHSHDGTVRRGDAAVVTALWQFDAAHQLAATVAGWGSSVPPWEKVARPVSTTSSDRGTPKRLRRRVASARKSFNSER